MDASELRDWIALFLMNAADDGQGGLVETIPPGLVYDRPARVETLQPGQITAADQLADRVRYRITIRYDVGITTTYRVYWNDGYLSIVSATNPDQLGQWLELICERKEAGAQ
jgi:head-tail adaptor